MRSLDELIEEYTEQINREGARLMEEDGLSPSEAGDKARTLVDARRKKEAYDRRNSKPENNHVR